MNNAATIYHSQTQKTEKIAKNYNKTAQSLYRNLAYRDIPTLIAKYVLKKNALDFGSGTGISSKFLLDLGFKVTGVDKSEEMIKQAKKNCPDVDFYFLNDDLLPFASKTFDFVFSSFVLLEIATKNIIINYLEQAKQVLKPEGIFIAITGSEYQPLRNWFTLDVDFPENKNLRSGDKYKTFYPIENIKFTNFYWMEKDYRNFFEKAGFELLEIHYPLGKDDESVYWKDEKKYSPYVIFVAKPFEAHDKKNFALSD